MIVLGIESTAHTLGVAILDDKKVLSNVRDLFSTEKGGMVPFEVADHHVKLCDEILTKALEKAGVGLDAIELISYSMSPGMGHALRIGATIAKTLALKLNVPLVGVNHCIAHLEIGRALTDAKDPVLLYASGVNTQIIAFEGERYRIFGETLDMGIGNFLDSFGRLLALGFPAGPKIEKLALKADKNKLVELPYSVKGMDISLTGMFTKLRQLINDGKHSKEELCYSVQETAFAMLVEISERALAHCDKNELVLGGGVACNKRLQDMCNQMMQARGGKSYAPANEFLIDNAAMIAWTGIVYYKQGKVLKIEEAGINPYERTDDVAFKGLI